MIFSLPTISSKLRSSVDLLQSSTASSAAALTASFFSFLASFSSQLSQKVRYFQLLRGYDVLKKNMLITMAIWAA